MPENNNSPLDHSDMPEAVIHSRKSFSVVWIVPIVALIIGAWLVYKAMSERGPEITITFESAEGLEAGKTKIKFKDVEVGLVESIGLSEDLSRVIVSAKLAKGSEEYLTDKTRFWIVKARVAAGEISGLNTLFAGSYIAVDPGRGGNPKNEFKGLDRPPIVTADLPGRHFMLQAEKLGSLDMGAPVYHKQIKVGQVVNYALDSDHHLINIRIFVNEPYDQFVQNNTRFWNAGGFDVVVDANGIRIDTESIVTILLGGIAFDTPVNLEHSAPAKENDTFALFNNHFESQQKRYSKKTHWLLRFDDSVRGLTRGSPVEFRGIKIGQVIDINLNLDLESQKYTIPVLIEIEPERMLGQPEFIDKADRQKFMDDIVAKGLRAQLKMGNLLTGQLYVDLNFQAEALPQKIVWNDTFPEFPTVKTQLEVITASVNRLVDRLNKLPFEEISNEVRVAVREFSQMLTETQTLLKSFNKEVEPEAIAALKQAHDTMEIIEEMLSSDSSMNQEARRALEELAGAARSFRSFVDYLNRHPDAIIYGKGKDQ
ncbi:MAG: MCE family protein [Desulfobacteraceae bacterium]|nr:MCE family protein [Desulfobacteraceae bacterium]MBC2757556.1 MCE family protein [Desulfobacteraceae bacterium]